jgi:hypothetical protein
VYLLFKTACHVSALAKIEQSQEKTVHNSQDTWGDSFAHLAMIFLLQEALGMLSG